ncbi:MAG: hypothetical protein AB1488_01725, partial [Nitrospirota bacterium]
MPIEKNPKIRKRAFFLPEAKYSQYIIRPMTIAINPLRDSRMECVGGSTQNISSVLIIRDIKGLPITIKDKIANTPSVKRKNFLLEEDMSPSKSSRRYATYL